MHSYRFDNRSPEEFARDIKSRTMEERAIFLLWLDFVEHDTGHRPSYKDTGCGQTGDVLEDHEVSSDPDFYVDGYGLVEVKFSKPMLKKFFHLKSSQVRQYCKKDTTILMVRGTDSQNPLFTMLKPNALKEITKDCKEINWQGFGGKLSYRIPVDRFVWRSFKYAV